MKISKLFHWLYAILMFLPVFFIGGRTLYTIFNKNAYLSYSGTNQNTQSNEVVNNIDNFDYSKTYYITNTTLNTSFSAFSTAYLHFDDVEIMKNNTTISNETFNQVDRVYFYCSDIYVYPNFYVGNNNLGALNSDTPFILKVHIRAITGTTTNINNLNNLLEHSSALYYIEYFNEQQLDNAFTYSMNEINDNPLFSWASTSFLVEPMSYIGNLFGLSATSPIITMLSYWLSISLIWLVFDLVMYVPLLVHRWIDKGIIE